jgi:hypothetical protein
MGKNSSNSRVVHYDKDNFPYYWKLYDHTKLVSCLCVSNAKEQAELTLVMAKANAECEHDLPGKCISIKPTSYAKWKAMH